MMNIDLGEFSKYYRAARNMSDIPMSDAIFAVYADNVDEICYENGIDFVCYVVPKDEYPELSNSIYDFLVAGRKDGNLELYDVAPVINLIESVPIDEIEAEIESSRQGSFDEFMAEYKDVDQVLSATKSNIYTDSIDKYVLNELYKYRNKSGNLKFSPEEVASRIAYDIYPEIETTDFDIDELTDYILETYLTEDSDTVLYGGTKSMKKYIRSTNTANIAASASKNWKTYWFGIEDPDSELCGEEFFVELEDASKSDAIKYAKSIFPGERLKCYGEVSEVEAEMMGLDTY